MFTNFTLDQFRADMLAQGYDEVLERQWTPGTVIDLHQHDFEANAIVVQGEMVLAIDGEGERTLKVGDRFHLQPGTWHAETYSATEGATYWVARKRASAL
jgi:mannose-6-phosphate isomerase-like protein (cupin superfamily)